MTATLFQGRAPRLWLRLEQHLDKPFYVQLPPDMVDGFILNANLVEGSPAACASFLDALDKPFVIDPMSYRFDRPDWYTRDKDGDIIGKRNYARLWTRYAGDVDGLTGDPLQDLGAVNVDDEVALARYCRNVVDFQELRLAHAWIADGMQYAKTMPLFGMEETGPTIGLAPAAYLAPYVVIDGETRDALSRRAVTLARITATVASARPVLAVLALGESALADGQLVRRLASEIAASGVIGALLWTVGSSDIQLAESVELFTGLTVLVRNLREADLEVGLLYGGILSTLLRGFGVSGFSHASLYGEQRGLDPSGGRTPSRFYVPPLRTFLSYPAAQVVVADISAADYLDRICACTLCAAVLADDPAGLGQYFETYLPPNAKRPIPTSMAAELNKLHFLLARGNELQFARNRTEMELISSLLAAVDRYPSRVTRAARAWAMRLKSA